MPGATPPKPAVLRRNGRSLSCADLIGDQTVSLHSKDGRTVPLRGCPRTVFPVAIVADHYPALAFQARHFLKAKFTERIVQPVVTDVFALDAMTEMLRSPLRMLSYLNFRARHSDKLMASHEHVVLSYHLKKNLWFESSVDLAFLQDDVSSDLDSAMAVRREGVPGAAPPDGILTRFEGTPFESIVSEIEDKADPVALNLGLMLLELGEDTICQISEHIGEVLKRTKVDGRGHNMVIGVSGSSTGLTVHCKRTLDHEAASKLRRHCEVRKYVARADNWFGLALSPDGDIRLVAEVAGDWKQDPVMDRIVKDWSSRR